MALIECVPNVSEGRRPDVIETFLAAIRRVAGVRLRDHSPDASHNRSVLTMVGEAGPLKEAVLALFEVASKTIDLRSHRGEHPRLGAVDVVPFIPIDGVTMADVVGAPDDRARTTARSETRMSTSAPVATLVILGAVIAVLGLFAAGNIVVTSVGLIAIFAAGILQVAAAKVNR